jgi:hypothetical protein
MKNSVLTGLVTGIFVFTFNAVYAQQWDVWVGDSITTYSTPKGVIWTLKKEGDSLLVGGTFSHIGQQSINSMAVWNGNTWNGIGNGLPSALPSGYGAAIQAFGRFTNQLYAAGDINGWLLPIKAICKFDDPDWLILDTSNINGEVHTIIEYDSLLFVGGGFSIYPTTPYIENIATYNDSGWEYVGWPGRPRDFCIYNGDLYAGTWYYGIRKWEGGTNWSIPFGGVWGSVECAIVDTFNNFLYISGTFQSVGGGSSGSSSSLLTRNVAMWDGRNWNAFGNELYGTVEEIEIYQSQLFAAGYFQVNQITGDTLNFIACWNGQHWVSLENGTNNSVNSLEIYRDTLFVGGHFDTISNQKCYGLAKWYMPPDTDCTYLQPRAFVLDDTLTLWQGHAGAQFYNNNAYADSWYWDFGDGFYSTEKDPLHDYTDTGIYNVSVTVSHNGCTKTATNTVLVEINTGTEQSEKWDYGFKIYPNPTSDEIIVECNMPQNVKGEIKTFNNYGSVRGTFPLQYGQNKIQIKSDEIPTGISLCGLNIEGKQVLIEKVVKLIND